MKQINGNTYVECVLCGSDTRLLLATRAKGLTGFRRLEVELDHQPADKVKFDPLYGFFVWVPAIRTGYVCEDCAASSGVSPAGETSRRVSSRGERYAD